MTVFINNKNRARVFKITGTKVSNPTASKTSVNDGETVILSGKLVTGQVIEWC